MEASAEIINKYDIKIPLAVNVSVHQFKGDVPGFVAKVCDIFSGIPRHLIELEVTESHRADDDVAQFVKLCQEQGIKVALDDFGEGLTGIDLFKIPFDYLKIDQKFIRNWDNPTYQRWVAFVLLEMKKASHTFQAVAEGVENTEIIPELHALGVDYFQGYGLGRPMPVADFAALCARQDTAS